MWVKGEIFRDFDDVERAARGTLDRESQISPFDRLDWFRRTWTHCPPGDWPLIVRARTEGSDAWLFLAERGDGTAVGLASWYTLAYRPVITGDPSEVAARALLVATARRLKPRLAQIGLDHVPERDAELLRSAFRRAGWVARVTPQVANWSIDVAGQSVAEYWAQRPGQLRSTVKRKGAKVALDIRILDRFDDAAWSDYADVYADSWKPDEGSLFLREMAEEKGAAGCLRLGIAALDGRPVAAQLWTVSHGRAIIHKLAHREEVSELSVGTLLTKAMFERVIDRDHVAHIDFGTGDDRYKADWMDTRVMRMRVDLYNPAKPRGLAGAAKAGLRALVGRDASR